MATDQRPAAFEPVIVRDAMFHIERRLDSDGEVHVRTSDRVEPSTELASAMVSAGRPLMLNIARELEIEPEAVSRYLSKPVGSAFNEGEPLARARRGLRSVSCPSPVSATLSSLDQTTGVVTLQPQSRPQQLYASLYGVVDSVIDSRGVVLRASGSRIQGVLGFGGDTHGQLSVAVDRADRELTADMVDSSFQDSIVLAGMTLGTSALRRLVEVGARGVIVGSISDSEVRRFLTTAEGEPDSLILWRQRIRDFAGGQNATSDGLTVLVTEGFGRRRMAQPVFQFLLEHEGQAATILVPDAPDVMTARPSLYITSDQTNGEDLIQRVQPRDGTVARLTDPEHLGIVVTCRSGVMDDPRRPGVSREVVDVEFNNGTHALVPALSLEVLEP